jgi:hypothetical protein
MKKNAIYIGIAGILGYLFYSKSKSSGTPSDEDEVSFEDIVDIYEPYIDVDGEVYNGQLDPIADVIDVPVVLGNILTDINDNEYQEQLLPDKVINLNTDEQVVEDYGQSNFNYEGLIDSNAGEVVQFFNQFIQVDVHNVNNFEYWFVISNISCLQGFGNLWEFNIINQTTMQPIEPISLATNVIGYQFNDAGVVQIEIIIACEDNYDNLLDPIILSFYLAVGGYTELGGGLVTSNDEEYYADIDTNKE